ncbi:MAG: hypothetical protein QGI93_00190 [Planctomycetota bacterium]|jgi:hypothetical protein|nr:hypothetical protein [Planctomycetota bacterium]MDP6740858.1 hypothetical protein [Planctomycetota bacterium]MDP6938263.1 hypothetical protein [Planctomycetota bacterium]
MSDFLKENWIWIVAPIALVAIGVIVILTMSSEDPAAPFTYTLR